MSQRNNTSEPSGNKTNNDIVLAEIENQIGVLQERLDTVNELGDAFYGQGYIHNALPAF